MATKKAQPEDEVQVNDSELETSTDTEEESDGFAQPDRLTLLKRKATHLGISFRDNISETTLAARIEEHLSGEGSSKDVYEEAEEGSKPKAKATTTDHRKRSQRLVRVVVRPIDPRRTQLNGELVTAGNSKIGMTGKFVPFNIEAGYHVPEIILNALKDRTFTEFYTVEDKHGNEETKSRQRKAFLIEELPPLTQKEIDEIAARQRATLADGDD